MTIDTSWGVDPVQVKCPSCRAIIQTRVKRKTTTQTHVCALLLCLCLCWPCVCLPYCSKIWRHTEHYCPNCDSHLHTDDS